MAVKKLAKISDNALAGGALDKKYMDPLLDRVNRTFEIDYDDSITDPAVLESESNIKFTIPDTEIPWADWVQKPDGSYNLTFGRGTESFTPNPSAIEQFEMQTGNGMYQSTFISGSEDHRDGLVFTDVSGNTMQMDVYNQAFEAGTSPLTVKLSPGALNFQGIDVLGVGELNLNGTGGNITADAGPLTITLSSGGGESTVMGANSLTLNGSLPFEQAKLTSDALALDDGHSDFVNLTCLSLSIVNSVGVTAEMSISGDAVHSFLSLGSTAAASVTISSDPSVGLDILFGGLGRVVMNSSPGSPLASTAEFFVFTNTDGEQYVLLGYHM
jgi:hypothetical protein